MGEGTDEEKTEDREDGVIARQRGCAKPGVLRVVGQGDRGSDCFPRFYSYWRPVEVGMTEKKEGARGVFISVHPHTELRILSSLPLALGLQSI